MGGVPKERDGLFKDETPLLLPIDLRKAFRHGDGFNQCLEATPVNGNVCIRDFVEGHEYWGEDGVHRHRDR